MFKIPFRPHLARFYSTTVNTKKPLFQKKPVIYGDEASPPVRFVLMTASALGIEFDFRHIDLFAAKQKTESYKKINPLQKVPALVLQDKDKVIGDSHAIATFLCQWSGDESLYPKDALLKATVNQLLYFNCSTMFPIDSEIYADFFSGKWPIEPMKMEKLNSALDHLEYMLNQNTWLASDKMHLCDLCLMSTVSSIYEIVPKMDRHVKVGEWLKRLDELPFSEPNKRGLERLLVFVKMVESQRQSQASPSSSSNNGNS